MTPDDPTATVFDSKTESFGLAWEGKVDALREIDAPCAGALMLCAEESLDLEVTENLIIEGDNLDALKLLRGSSRELALGSSRELPLDTYREQVRLIYIDPPYNTGNDFVYDDKFRQRANASDASGSYHSRWLSMIYPRLALARDLLRQDGLIAISIDDNEAHHLRCLLDEIFGRESFIGQICIVSNPRGRQSGAIATTHEYLVAYARDPDRCVIEGEQLSSRQLADYKHTTDDGRRYRLRGLRHRGNASRRADRPRMYFPLFVDPRTRRVSLERTPEFSVEVLPRKSTGEDSRWEWGVHTARDRVDRLEAVFVERRQEWDVHQREFLVDASGRPRRRKWTSVWDEKEINYQNGRSELKALFGSSPFDYPKPLRLLRKLIDGATSSGDIVLDFFAGSGTTGHAVLEQNAEDGAARRYILVQAPVATNGGEFATIADITRARLRAARVGIIERRDRLSDLDLGFRALRVAY
jgi:adenine-specific DNA-methyltransferase